MPTLKVCRICLVTNVKLFKYDRYELKKYYEQILHIKINEKDGSPRYFCYMCAAMLYKFHKFKEKCLRGQTVLKELIYKGPITIKSISNINRCTKNLESSLDIITINQRVRTYVIKSKQTPKVEKPSSPVKIEIDSDSSAGDDNCEERAQTPSLSPELVEVERKIEDGDEKVCQEDAKVYDDKSDVVEEKVTRTEKLSDDQKESDDEILRLSNEEIQNENEKVFVNGFKHSVEIVGIKEESDIVFDEKKEYIKCSEKTNILAKPSDDEKQSDDGKVFDNDNNHSENDSEIKQKLDRVFEEKKKYLKSNKKKKRRKVKQIREINKKRKKFEVSNKKKTDLDPNNWLKINLNEDEAIEEFKARALQKRFISAEYKCNDCLKGFSKEDMLNRHLKLRHSETVGPIECKFCRMRFKWKCYLRKHMRQHYTKYKCLRCDLVCPLETTALFHEEYHNGVIRKCAHCDEEFKHLTTYYTHLRTHRSEHVCTLCGASFVSAIGLKIHKKIKHVNSETTVSEETDGAEEYCQRCDIKFETRKAYEEHLIHSAMHVDGLEDLEVEVPIGSNPRKRRRNQNRRLTRIPTDCHICGKHFATQAACRKHHLAEHPRTSFFAPNERHICEICGLSLAPGSVSSHINTHTRAKLYSCKTCGKEFNSKGGMTTHQLTHTSEKPVACTLCDKRFKQISSMRLHYRTFHLKEPYPKRNRRKKMEEVLKLDEYPPEDTHEDVPQNRWR